MKNKQSLSLSDKNIYSNYRAGDFLIRVKNAGRAQNAEVSVPVTKMVRAIANSLKEEGYLTEVSEKDGILTVKLAISHKKPVLMDLKLVSTPGLRVYADIDKLKARKVRSSSLILTTPKGIMSQRKAIKQNTGGEVIAEVW